MLGRRENLPRVTPTRRVRRTSHARLQRRVEASSSEVGVGTVLENPSTRAAYELVERLGSGSFADTFRAQTSTGDEVAVKTLTLRSGKRGGMNGGFKAVELFERECATLRSMRHPNVPEYLDSFSLDTADDRRYVLVQRLARGSTLQQRVESGWRPTEVEIKSVLRQLLEVAKYCCALRPPVIHRDIKPANVVLDHDGMVNVVDFGSAAAAAIEDPLGGFGSTIVGTFGYMAPEVMMRQSSVRSDQYGIGSTILYLLSGRPPSGFAMERLKINFDDVYIEDRQLRRVVERLLEPSPEDRWRDPQEALDALDAKPPMVSGRNFRRRPNDIDVLAPSGLVALEDPYSQVALQSVRPTGAPKPKTMVTELVRDRGNSVSIIIPPSGANGAILYKAFFGITWTGITALWTVGVLSAGAWFMALFSIPFWGIGANLSGEVLQAFLAKGEVFIDGKNFRVISEGGGMKFMEKTGDTDAVEGAFVRGDGVIYLKLEDDSVVPILASMSRKEAEYIASEINAHLDERP